MKKIPTLFKRDPENMKQVLPEVTPGCEWVLAGEGVATRKYDGTCVLIRRDGLAVHAFARREVKPGQDPPEGWVEADHDDATGKRVGWEPAGQSGFSRWIAEALVNAAENGDPLPPGTYELCGPKVQGNPEGLDRHLLIPHADAERMEAWDHPTWDTIAPHLPLFKYEGIVWHHPDGRMAKIKRRDFPKPKGPQSGSNQDP